MREDDPDEVSQIKKARDELRELTEYLDDLAGALEQPEVAAGQLGSKRRSGATSLRRRRD